MSRVRISFLPTMTTMTDEEILQLNLLTALGLEDVSEEQKIQLINDITDLVQRRVMLQVVSVLSDQDNSELDKLVQNKGAGDPAVADFLQEKVPNLLDIFKQELITVKRELLNRAEDK